jgi:hypothetical protein
MRRKPLLATWLIACALFAVTRANGEDGPQKPKAAVFPLGGNASAALKERVGFSFRAKLDRDATYEVIQGPTINDLVGDKVITLATTPDVLKSIVEDEKPVIYIWGELNDAGGGQSLKINVLDVRVKDSKPQEISKTISDPTDLRFVVEQVLETIKGVKKFEHPIEQSVWDDAESRRLWAKNPNLVPDPDFATSGPWTTLYMAEKYPAPLSTKLPAVDKVCILGLPSESGRPPHNVLAMNLSRECAENNGMACLSEFIKIEPNTRYRLQFKYKSNGPSLHVFVKGYTMGPSAVSKEIVKREVYKRQVPPSGGTGGKWVTIVDDMNPQHPTWPVQFLRVDLYAYLSPGVVMFDDIQLKAVGGLTDHAKE